MSKTEMFMIFILTLVILLSIESIIDVYRSDNYKLGKCVKILFHFIVIIISIFFIFNGHLLGMF